MNENASADYKTVRGLSRGLLLLNLLNKFDGGATVGTLAEFSGLHRTTVRRLLETLQDEGYVRRSRSDDSFRLTIKGKRAARTVLTGMCYSVGSATRQGSSSLTRFIGQSAMTSRT